MTRITKQEMEKALEWLNKAANRPMRAYSQQGDGTWEANLGNYHIIAWQDYCALACICNSGGGVTTVFSNRTRSGLYLQIIAYTKGIEEGKGIGHGSDRH